MARAREWHIPDPPAWVEEETEQSATEQVEKESPQTPKAQIRTSSREELIECIKRGQKPTWVPKPGLQALRVEEEALQEKRNSHIREEKESLVRQRLDDGRSNGSGSRSGVGISDPIARPRSALHRGDFGEPHPSQNVDGPSSPEQRYSSSISPTDVFGSSPPPWLAASPARNLARTVSELREARTAEFLTEGRRRAPSLGSSLSSSFVMRTPTSPLVYATSTNYLDGSDPPLSQPTESTQERGVRRRTLPPGAFQSHSTSADDDSCRLGAPCPGPAVIRREASMPHQTHQPRRSLSSFTYQPGTASHFPFPRSRRPSGASESGSRLRSSMVGSFEESILRGSMSTPPSKPLDFVAQIGVMGKGKCPTSLKCPAHVSVQFPAVFYNYPAASGSRSLSDDAPSPYVGAVDLDNNLKAVHLGSKRKRPAPSQPEVGSDRPDEAGKDRCGRADVRGVSQKSEERGARAESPRISIGGAYRVPPQGQLQIIIKNPNKTAVKLFLIPYDLEGMEAGTKTFVRQRSYSSGPIIEKALGDKVSRANLFDPLENKHLLRYLIHVKFCCPARGRYYLHDCIRVVFANRVPDGKEKLRNEIQLPEPKFSVFKPKGVMGPGSSPAPLTAPTSDSGRPLDTSPQIFGDMEDLVEGKASTSFTPQRQTDEASISFHFSTPKPRPASVERPREADLGDDQFTYTPPSPVPIMQPHPQALSKKDQPFRGVSPVAGFRPLVSPRASPTPWTRPSSSSTGRSFSPVSIEAGDGLLSRQFRGLHGSSSSGDPTIDAAEDE